MPHRRSQVEALAGPLAARQQSGEGGDEGGSQVLAAGYQVEQDLGEAVGGVEGIQLDTSAEGAGTRALRAKQPDDVADDESDDHRRRQRARSCRVAEGCAGRGFDAVRHVR